MVFSNIELYIYIFVGGNIVCIVGGNIVLYELFFIKVIGWMEFMSGCGDYVILKFEYFI